MLIQTVIDHIKEYHKGVFEGKQIDEQTTRDKVLYGNPHQECTGIITTKRGSVELFFIKNEFALVYRFGDAL